MFATILRCVARKIQVRSSKVKVTLRGQRSLRKGVLFLCPLCNFLCPRRAAYSNRIVRPSVRPSVRPHFRVRSVTLSYVGGFQNYLAEMFATIRRCVACKIQVRSCKVKVTLRDQRSENGSNFRVCSVSLSFFGGFLNH